MEPHKQDILQTGNVERRKFIWVQMLYWIIFTVKKPTSSLFSQARKYDLQMINIKACLVKPRCFTG